MGIIKHLEHVEHKNDTYRTNIAGFQTGNGDVSTGTRMVMPSQYIVLIKNAVYF
jgi:hypothetical protein